MFSTQEFLFSTLSIITVLNSSRRGRNTLRSSICRVLVNFALTPSYSLLSVGNFPKVTGASAREVYKFVAPRALIAQRGRNSSCEYFYTSIGCPQLTSSSCDVRVPSRVARRRYFKCECKSCLFKTQVTQAHYLCHVRVSHDMSK